ncbi:hypothetical protein [Hyphomonas sp.]|jgi:hypothetical protein|uniref:hypothetical protein n=1 Tax=Hyphomonas sp. TaxID=87 RepID=UPI00356B0612
MQRNDMIGAACAIVAIGLVVGLSLESWAIADCWDVLRTGDFQRAGTLEPAMAEALSAFRSQLEAGSAGPEADACIARVGLPF